MALPFTIWTFFLALMLATMWHELGHFAVARLLRVPVRLIGVGIGPALWRFRLNDDIRMEVRALPVGMAIGVVGRRTADGHARRPAGHDLAVAAGGPGASLLLAALCLALAIPARALPGLQGWLIGTALLSAFLAVLNLAPLPGLDGGHMFLLAGACFGWQLTPQQEVNLHRVGLRVLAGACVLTALASFAVRVAAHA